MSNGASDETYTQNKINISGSNEIMQNAQASIVKVWRIFEIFSVLRISKIWTYFSSDLGKIYYGGNIDKKTAQNFFEMATAIFWST